MHYEITTILKNNGRKYLKRYILMKYHDFGLPCTMTYLSEHCMIMI